MNLVNGEQKMNEDGQQDLLLEHARCNPEICGGKPTFKGTRLSVMIIVDSLRAGHSPEELLNAYPPPLLTSERIDVVQELLRIRPMVTEEELRDAITSKKGLRYFEEKK